jgi:hypothetical protein
VNISRRGFLKCGIAGLPFLVGGLLCTSPSQAQQQTFDLTIQQTGNWKGVTTAGQESLGQVAIGDLPSIDSYKVSDLPNAAYLSIDSVPGLTALLGLPQGISYTIGDFPELLNMSIGQIPGLKALTINQLPGFAQIAGFNLEAGLQEITFDLIPGLLDLPTNFAVQLSTGLITTIFGGFGVVPSMVELITFRQYSTASDGVLYVIDRGRPWTVGEYRYLNPYFRVKLDSILDHAPGTGYYYCEVLICSFGGCTWVGPFYWPTAYEQQYHLWIPPAY